MCVCVGERVTWLRGMSVHSEWESAVLLLLMQPLSKHRSLCVSASRQREWGEKCERVNECVCACARRYFRSVGVGE